MKQKLILLDSSGNNPIEAVRLKEVEHLDDKYKQDWEAKLTEYSDNNSENLSDELNFNEDYGSTLENLSKKDRKHDVKVRKHE